MSTISDSQRRELGDFLRSQRARLSPEAVGFPAGSRRRTPGLRREEIAQLCGISVTWYTWIEQGRTVSVSPQALSRIAETLQLSRAKRAYLFELSGKKDPSLQQAVSEDIPPEVLRVVRGIKGPAYLLDRYWNVVAWNPAAKKLFSGWLDQKQAVKNLLYFMFCMPAAQSLISDWEQRARRLVAEFRADCGMLLDDPQIQDMVGALAANSAVFKRAWGLHDVVER